MASHTVGEASDRRESAPSTMVSGTPCAAKCSTWRRSTEVEAAPLSSTLPPESTSAVTRRPKEVRCSVTSSTRDSSCR